MAEESEKLGAAKWSILVNIGLTAMKLIVGIYTGSLGILAELVHSVFDLIASGLAYLGIKKAEEPPDMTHAYGHERFENVSGLMQSLLITATSLLIIYEAYRKLTGAEHVVKESLIGIAAMLVAIVVDIAVSRYLHKKSRDTGSPALEADAYHFTSDIISTVAVIIGLAAAGMGYPIADVLSAVIVALIMLFLSLQLGKKAISVMLDRAPDDGSIERIATILSNYPDILGYHALRARVAGNKIFVDVSVHLKPDLSLEEAHQIAEDLEMNILEKCPNVKDVVIHIEPETSHDSGSLMRRLFDR